MFGIHGTVADYWWFRAEGDLAPVSPVLRRSRRISRVLQRMCFRSSKCSASALRYSPSAANEAHRRHVCCKRALQRKLSSGKST